MALDFTNLNWVAVVAAAVAGVVIGFIWYMPQVFGRRWAAESGQELPEGMSGVGMSMLVGTIVVPLVVAYALAVLMKGLGAASIVDGLVVGLVVWLGFAAAPAVNNVLYEKRSWMYWAIGVGFALVSLLAMGAIIGYLGA